MSYLLAIDSGNTTIKWGLHNGNDWHERGIVAQNQRLLLSQIWQDVPEPSAIIVSNVAGSSAEAALLNLFAIWKAIPHWISATAYQCGVRNHYSNPAQLGSDRWAALIAAWRMRQQGCLVVNVGTAMTVDTLSDRGEFLGGIILPGFNLMKQALANQTALLTLKEGRFQDFPVNTADAIHSGVVHALTGALDHMYTLLSANLGRDTLNCIISGGGAALLLPYIKIPTMIVDYLVLEGLKVIAQEKSEIVQ
ncbi:type III pantothenate kinase [Nitrosomonas sp. Is37]|uniref:type III pantothenate kinase n=1 Tax=Nitrosomonas sp. Is37 TaxID=3080535 RepID=UPI00294B5581|nr:type III pantothenate kinase [Nitrosomonas sp. Is37]MDV6344465.1 type III pantothenate kinase [Nitrosomonas sp. Is37]